MLVYPVTTERYEDIVMGRQGCGVNMLAFCLNASIFHEFGCD